MAVVGITYASYYPPAGVPLAPSNVTSVTKDAGATVSFLAPAANGTSPVTSWTVTPYISGVAQAPTTVSTGSAGSITGSNGSTYVQVPVTGLTNSTAYTFTAKAVNARGAGPESGQSGANTPLSGLVFGDDFNGAASGPVDPEWWIYDNRCGYLAQSELEAYAASHCVLDGSGNLKLTAEHASITVPRYPSDPLFPGNVTQPWTSGACQSNTRTYAPAAGNTMTFEVRQKVMADAGNGYWPGFLWLEGQAFLTAWKTDPDQTGWNTTTQAEIDIAEWPSGQSSTTQFVENAWTGASGDPSSHAPLPGGGYDATTMNIYQCRWKPGVSTTFWLNGSQLFSATHIAASGAQFFLLIYLQMVAGGPTTTESCFVDYVRVYDQNLG
jgi:hypothetical protein